MAVQNNVDNVIEAPAPTAWPMIFALGLTLAFAGLVTSIAVSMVGFILTMAGAVGWFPVGLPVEHREAVCVEPVALPISPPTNGVDYLSVRALRNLRSLPFALH